MQFIKGPDSLTTLLAGTLQVPLNLVTTDTVTAGNTQIVGTSSGIVANALTGKTVDLQANGVSLLNVGATGAQLGTAVPLNLGATGTPTTTARQLIGDSTGVLLNTPASTQLRLTIAGALVLQASDTAAGGVNIFNPRTGRDSYTAVTAAEDAVSDHGATMALTGLNYSTHPTRGVEVQNKVINIVPTGTGAYLGAFDWYMDNIDGSGGCQMVARLAAAGVLSLYKAGTFGSQFKATLSPASITADRAFTFPDTAGELMVSGGSGSVSLTNLTAGTLGVDLNINGANVVDFGTAGTSTVTAGHLQIAPVSTVGLVYNTPSNLFHSMRVNNVAYFEVDPTGAYLSDAVRLVMTAYTGTITTSTSYIATYGDGAGTHLGVRYNTRSGKRFQWRDATSEILGLDTANGLTLASAIPLNLGSGGTVTAGNRQVIGTSAGVVINTPTSTSVSTQINGVATATLTATALTYGSAMTSMVSNITSMLGGGAGVSFLIGANTSDGSDSGLVSLCGGGAGTQARGARVQACGNEHATLAGLVRLIPGEAGSVLILDSSGATAVTVNTTGIVMSDSYHLTTNATTGTKIGNGGKIGLFDATPIARPTTGVAAATRVAGAGTGVLVDDTFDGYTVAQIVKALRNLGVLT